MPTVTGVGAVAGTGAAAATGVALGFVSPDADSSAGAWTNQTGGTPLYPSIDEHLASNDTDFIQSPGSPSASSCKISLGDPGIGILSQPLGISYRYGKIGTDQIDIVVTLMQGTTSIASWTHTNVSATPTTVRQVLTTPQFNAISDFTNLFLSFQANNVLYVGPGDVVSGATRYLGTRAYMLSTVGANAIRLRRDSDQAESDFVTITSGGLDLAGIASFMGAANLFVTKFYDQVGTNHYVQSTAAKQFQLVLSGLGSLPITVGNSAAGTNLASSALETQAQPYTISAVARRTSNFSNAQLIVGETISSIQLRYENAVNTAMMYAGTVQTAPATDNLFHALQGVFNGGSSDLNVDGTVHTINPGTTGYTTTTINIGTYDGSSFGIDGNILEVMRYPFAFTPTQSSNMSANQRAYFGF